MRGGSAAAATGKAAGTDGAPDMMREKDSNKKK
jgi:hypothetical protein